MKFQESPEALHLRQQMVARQVRGRGISDERVLGVMGEIPRHEFIPPASRAAAYMDQPVPIGSHQTISQPYIVALMTEHLALQPSHTVLEIGTGCGYQTAILARLCRQVYTIERIEYFSVQARRRLLALGIENVRYHVGNGARGWPRALAKAAHQATPSFDRILVTAAAATVPEALLEQLAPAGRLILPLGPTDQQRLQLIERIDDKTVERMLCYCRFVRLIED